MAYNDGNVISEPGAVVGNPRSCRPSVVVCTGLIKFHNNGNDTSPRGELQVAQCLRQLPESFCVNFLFFQLQRQSLASVLSTVILEHFFFFILGD